MSEKTHDEQAAEMLEGRLSHFAACITAHDDPGELTARQLVDLDTYTGADWAGLTIDELADELPEKVREHLGEFGLSLDVETRRNGADELTGATVTWCLSTGGPHDEFVFELSPGQHVWDVDAVRFVFLPWFGRVERELYGDNRETLERIAEILGITEPGIVLPLDER